MQSSLEPSCGYPCTSPVADAEGVPWPTLLDARRLVYDAPHSGEGLAAHDRPATVPELGPLGQCPYPASEPPSEPHPATSRFHGQSRDYTDTSTPNLDQPPAALAHETSQCESGCVCAVQECGRSVPEEHRADSIDDSKDIIIA